MITQLDHLVLTVRSIPESVRFYTEVLGMEPMVFGAGRVALRFGRQKINLHEFTREFEPKAMAPTPGSADLCFITERPLSEVSRHLESCGTLVIEGPVHRSGAMGAIVSLYLRDPDGNLIELSNYDT